MGTNTSNLMKIDRRLNDLREKVFDLYSARVINVHAYDEDLKETWEQFMDELIETAKIAEDMLDCALKIG